MHAKARRPSGGISILIRKELRGKPQQPHSHIVKEDDCSIWLKIDRKILGIGSDLYVCAVYIPPEKSTYWYNKSNDPFSLLEMDVNNFQSKGIVIMLGDFNARTKTISDHISDFSEGDNIEEIVRNRDSNILDNLGRVGRNNMDVSLNSYGKSLISLCQTLNMRILNGRTPGDSRGKYTCHQYNGHSVVDYIICSEDIISSIPFMDISDPNHISDHSYISCNIGLGNNFHGPSNHTTKQKAQSYKWSSESSTIFRSALKLPRFEQELNDLFSSASDVDTYCSNLSKIINSVAKFCLKLKSRKPRKKSKLGFDNDCKKLKDRVLHLGKMVSKFPNDPMIYGDYINHKKSFKKLVKRKYRESKASLLRRIECLENKDPKNYWNLLKKFRDNSKEDTINPIDISDWTSYFTKLHNPEPLVTNAQKEFESKILEKLQNKLNKFQYV